MKNKRSVKKNLSDDDLSEEIINSRKWYEELQEDPKEFTNVDELKLVELKDEAKKLHDSETLAFSTKNAKYNKSSDYQWIKTVLVKGTTSDKIAAYTILIQDNPVYNLKTLQDLIGMVKMGKNNDCLKVMQTVSELFLENLLIPNRKLKPFYQRPLSQLNELSSGNIVTRKHLLTHWYFEDQLKETYTLFIKSLLAAAHDNVDTTKEKAITVMYNLLAGNPEQEKNLLANIVNKLGDPSQKVASKAVYCLNQLLYRHPNMKQVVLLEIEKLLFRSNVSHKAQYYSICFLSQYYLTHEDFEVAKHLITVYFAFFKACVKKNEIDTRMMSALLMGVNRAYPYARLELSQVNEHIDTLYKVVHQASFNVSLHALNLLFQVCDLNNSVNDRFYSALYKKLFDVNINITTHQALFLNLIFKALMKDSSADRINAFIKRLLQVALNSSVPMTCAILYTLSQMCRLKKHNLHLLHNSCIKEEESIEIDETETINQKESAQSNELSTNTMVPPLQTKQLDLEDDKNLILNRNTYDPFHRNPLYAGGQHSIHTELIILQDHFHPTVALFSKNLAVGEKIIYSGDPLKDFTLIRFLDRFVFKNPKKNNENEEKRAQTKGYHFKFGERKAYVPTGLRALAITSKNYLKENMHKVPIDELFMYKFLQKKMKAKIEKESDHGESDAESDIESVGSDEFNEMLDKMVAKNNKTNEKDVEDEINELNYMHEVGNSLKIQKNNTNEESESENDDPGEDFGMDENSDIDLEGSDEELNESDIEFSSDDEKSTRQSFKKSRNDLSSAFASAEEFATMLEDTGSSKFKMGMSTSFSNKDNADEKQMVWEDKRNQWISGYKKALGKKDKTKKSFSRKGQKRKSETRNIKDNKFTKKNRKK